MLEVFQQEEDSFVNAIRATVSPDFRPPNALPRVDPFALGGGGEDDDPYASPPAVTSAGTIRNDNNNNPTTPAAAQEKRQRLETADQDAYHGTPFDPFNMDALRRHMERRIALHAEPVVQFAAAVAGKLGRSPNAMLYNGGGPLLDASAVTLHDLLLHGEATLGKALVIPALVYAATDLLSASKNKPSPLSPEKGTNNGDGDSETGATPPEIEIKPVKTEGQKTEGKKIMNALIATAYARIGPGIGNDRPATLLQQLADVVAKSQEDDSAARWYWNRSAENLSMAVLDPALVEAMKIAHAKIEEMHPSGVLMWHLITGSHVRGDFAELVACSLRRSPGELQYPNYQSTRGPNVITGVRLSSGRWDHQVAAHGVQHQLRFFRDIYYGPSKAWADLQRREPDVKQAVQRAETGLQTALRDCVKAIDELWEKGLSGAVSEDGKRFTIHAYDLIELEKEMRQLPPSEQAAWRVRLETARQRVRKEFRQGLTGILELGAVNVLRLRQVLANREENALPAILAKVMDDLSRGLGKPRVFDRDGEQIALVADALDAVTAFKTAIAHVTHARKQQVETMKAMRTFPEEDKVELFHRKPAHGQGQSPPISPLDWQAVQYAPYAGDCMY